MSIGRIMYSKMPTKRKLGDFYEFGLPSIKAFKSILDIYAIWAFFGWLSVGSAENEAYSAWVSVGSAVNDLYFV